MSEWNDDYLQRVGGEGVSLLGYWRMKVKKLLENKYVSNFIYLMVIVLCVVIFTELSIGDILN